MIFCHADDPVYRFRTLVLIPHTDKAAINRSFSIGNKWSTVDAELMKNHLQVTVWDKWVASAINGKVVHCQRWLRPTEVFGTAERIGVGSGMKFGDAEVTFRNLRVRGLKERPGLIEKKMQEEENEQPREQNHLPEVVKTWKRWQAPNSGSKGRQG